ncbi:MAG: glycoside hydrolase [Acidobacteria bacterium]|nr:glycoside hydrolase [Acidobacteriota bacterium]
MTNIRTALLTFGALVAAAYAFAPGSYDPGLFAEMRWRGIGPLRGGRTKSAQGVASQPNVFYIGVCNGGIWKSTDYGRTWNPIFDDQPTGSIGALAVAPSNPDIIYAGSGEGLQRPDLSTGDGIYKSTDAGRTWTRLGLRDGQQIPQIAVDPRNPDKLFVAVLGHPYGPNPERGLYRSTDGGRTFEKVLGKDENTGANDVVIDPRHPDTVYAALWEARQGPWENSSWTGPGGGVFKSTDGGTTWKPLANGIPSGPEGFVQANLAIAPSNPNRLYASVATSQGTGIYRSDDGGALWTRATTDPRPAARIGGGDVSVPAVDPRNPDIVYAASVVTWKSTDGGRTWTGIRGAPGGDDYQRIWINPLNPDIILDVSDQGAIVTVNGGQTWSSWYNQSTAQMYHANTDNDFPYRVCSGQQESGSACVASRGNDGAITFREWHPVGVEEYGYAVPDPLNPNLVYGGKVTRYDRRTGQVENVAPKPIRGAGYRALRTAPLVFSQADPHVLFFGANTLFRTADGGHSWKEISPDLSRKTYELPASIGKYRDPAEVAQRGVIYAVAPSPLDINRIWAGTDDGLIHTTADGGATWKDVTPSDIGPWMKISILDAGHFDPLTAYAAVNTIRLDDMRPHIFRTHDGGKTWKEIVDGLPANAPVNAVREDPKTRGLLFAGTERQVYVSFDDGDHWQSLRLNMPASSVRDVAIKDDDLIAATHGRGFWILDDITPLRQLSPRVAGAEAFLFKPQTAIRVRWDMNTDTPLPPDEPAAPNPPDGAILDYYLGPNVTGPVTLEVLDASGALVRKYASTDPEPPADPMLAIPTYWVRPPRSLPATPGMHRYTWDMHYTPLTVGGGRGGANYPMQAIAHDTAPAITSIWAAPGRYTVRLTAGGKTYTQPLTLKMDPRVKTTPLGLQQQYTLSRQLYDDILKAQKAAAELNGLRAKLQGEALKEATAILGSTGGRGGRGGGGGGRGAIAAGPETLSSIPNSLAGLMRQLEAADVAPSSQLTAAIVDRHAQLTRLLARASAIR